MGNNETALEMLLLAFFVAVAVATRNDPDNGFCPAFYKVWDAYPSYDAHPSDALKEELGGDMTWMTNTCAIRTTMALRGLGIEAGDAMHTKWRDGKRRRYLIRVLEMEQYMRTVFGKPDWVGGAGIQEGRINVDELNPGPVDGLMGSKTRDAIKEFERIAGLPVTGVPTEELVAKIEAHRPIRR